MYRKLLLFRLAAVQSLVAVLFFLSLSELVAVFNKEGRCPFVQMLVHGQRGLFVGNHMNPPNKFAGALGF
jgi:hypothetical protein